MTHIEYDAAQNIVTTAETVVGQFSSTQSAPAIGGEPLQPVPAIIVGVINITPGTGATAVQVRVRQGSISGSVVGNLTETDTITAGVPSDIPFEAYDSVGSVPGWVITVQQVNATGNATVNFVSSDANYSE